MIAASTRLALDEIDQRLLNEFQHDLPLVGQPYAEIAVSLGVTEAEVMHRLERLQDAGAISRIGAVVKPNRVGTSTLAALSVPEYRLDEVARIVSSFPEVNHNYEREHVYNLWFVITAEDHNHLTEVLSDIHTLTGLEPLDLPMLEDFHIDLGFDLKGI